MDMENYPSWLAYLVKYKGVFHVKPIFQNVMDVNLVLVMIQAQALVLIVQYQIAFCVDLIIIAVKHVLISKD